MSPQELDFTPSEALSVAVRRTLAVFVFASLLLGASVFWMIAGWFTACALMGAELFGYQSAPLFGEFPMPVGLAGLLLSVFYFAIPLYVYQRTLWMKRLGAWFEDFTFKDPQ